MKKAFSLIELLIVIVIIGVVYTLSIGNFKKVSDDKKMITLELLKEYLQEIPYEESVKLLCLDDCSTCSVIVDGVKAESIDGFFDKSVTTYRYDTSYGMTEIEEDYGVCFSYDINKKGVGEQVFVEFKNKVYDFSTYLDATPVYSSLEDAKNAKEKLVSEILQ